MGSANLTHFRDEQLFHAQLASNLEKTEKEEGVRKAKLFPIRSLGHLLTLNVDQTISDVLCIFHLQLFPHLTYEHIFLTWNSICLCLSFLDFLY